MVSESGELPTRCVSYPVPADVRAFFAKKISQTQVKVYAKDIVGIFNAQCVVNGRDIPWVRASDAADLKTTFWQQ